MGTIVWCGADERDKKCPGLSRYTGRSHLMEAINEQSRLVEGECQRVELADSRDLMGRKPNRLSADRRAVIQKYLKQGRGITWIVNRMRCSTMTVYKVKREDM